MPEIPRSRHFVSEVMAEEGRSATDAVLLVASELITNAVRHGSGEVELRVVVEGDCIRLEVLDDGHSRVAVPNPPPSQSSLGGRGLMMVRDLSRRWGSGFDARGRTMVWAELPAS